MEMCCWDVEWIELAQLAILNLAVPVNQAVQILTPFLRS
jgi:hypothetical protein